MVMAESFEFKDLLAVCVTCTAGLGNKRSDHPVGKRGHFAVMIGKFCSAISLSVSNLDWTSLEDHKLSGFGVDCRYIAVNGPSCR